MLAVVASFASSAGAEVRVARTDVSEIQLAGRAVAYTEGITRIYDFQSVFYDSRIVLHVPGGRPRKLAEGSDSTNYELGENSNADVEWDTSESAFIAGEAIHVNRAAGTDDYTHLRGGLLPGPIPRVMRCDFGDAAPTVAVDGKLGAYEDTCHRAMTGSYRVVVRPLDDRRAEPHYVALEDNGRIDLAGPYLASATSEELDVLDWRDGTVRYSVAAPFHRRGELDFRAGELEMQADGTVAGLLRRRQRRCVVAWFSPSEPRSHVIGSSPCWSDVRIHSGKIVWLRDDGRGLSLMVTDLSGATRRIARSRRPTVLPWLDFDGQRVAYAVARCDERSVLLLRESLEGPVWVDRDPLRCPLRVRSTLVRVPAGRKTLELPVRCPRGCRGIVYLRDDYNSQPFSVTSKSRKLKIHLDTAARRDLERRGSATLPIRILSLHRAAPFSRKRLTLHLRRG